MPPFMLVSNVSADRANESRLSKTLGEVWTPLTNTMLIAENHGLETEGDAEHQPVRTTPRLVNENTLRLLKVLSRIASSA